ncbi:hypothetical protein GGX14DRAFT_576973 [Mycena pura]|uniref:Uncharacterized protein n=1 Tax=Mycena pura TaxID=153505 RepID=A0AAD6XZC9_9AGAR|nr:hypothetical protein GGX14DRAFT_576973 [Mycena pura]
MPIFSQFPPFDVPGVPMNYAVVSGPPNPRFQPHHPPTRAGAARNYSPPPPIVTLVDYPSRNEVAQSSRAPAQRPVASPPRQRSAQEYQPMAPAPSAHHPPTRAVAARCYSPPPPIAYLDELESPPESPPEIAQPITLPPLTVPPPHIPTDRPQTLRDVMNWIERTRTRSRWCVSKPSCTVPPHKVYPPLADATDAWHSTSGMLTHPAQSFDTMLPIMITFAPSHGPGLTGVALTELQRGRGLIMADTSLGDFISSKYHLVAVGRLIFEWPGYPNVQAFKLVLRDDRRRYTTRGDFGRQIADALHKFAEVSGPLAVRGVRGRHGILFEQLRLLEVFSIDGRDFYARLGVVPPPSNGPIQGTLAPSM